MDIYNTIRTLLSSPEDIAIRILNDMPYDILDTIFQRSQELSLMYRPLYELGIRNSKRIRPQVNIGSNDLLNSLNDINTYFQYHSIGLLSIKVTNFMGLTFIIDGRAPYTMEMLLNWWFTYLITNGLLVDNGDIQSDRRMDELFEEEYVKLDIIKGSRFRRTLLTEILSYNFETNENIELTQQELQSLFSAAQQLRAFLTQGQAKLINTNPKPESFLEQALKYEVYDNEENLITI